MLCKVEGCNKKIPGVQDIPMYQFKEYVGLCGAHKMALRRYGNTSGKQPFKQVCAWCNSAFLHKRETSFCSVRCRHKSDYQSIMATGNLPAKRFKQNNPEGLRAIWQRYRDKLKRTCPEKLKSRQKAMNTIPLKPCLVCGTTENVYRHHHDYSKPCDVTFLCREHHRQLHSFDSF